MKVSVIIPVRNEAARVAQAIDRARIAGADQVRALFPPELVGDGLELLSSDNLPEVLTQEGSDSGVPLRAEGLSGWLGRTTMSGLPWLQAGRDGRGRQGACKWCAVSGGRTGWRRTLI